MNRNAYVLSVVLFLIIIQTIPAQMEQKPDSLIQSVQYAREAMVQARHSLVLEGWETDKEFVARKEAFPASDAPEAVALQNAIKALETAVFVVSPERIALEVHPFDREAKSWTFFITSADPAFPYKGDAVYSIAGSPNIKAAFDPVDSAVRSGTLMAQIRYRIKAMDDGRYRAHGLEVRFTPVELQGVVIPIMDEWTFSVVRSNNLEELLTYRIEGLIHVSLQAAATILVDGHERLRLDGGKSGVIPDIEIGAREVEARYHDGHRESLRVMVTRDTMTKASFSYGFGNVRVSLAIDGTVFLDGSEQGTFPAGQGASLTSLASGTHLIEVRYPDGFIESQSVSANAGETAMVAFKHGFGRLRVTAVTTGTVWIDGNQVGSVIGGGELNLPDVLAGGRMLELRYDNGGTETKSVTVSTGQTTTVAFMQSFSNLRGMTTQVSAELRKKMEDVNAYVSAGKAAVATSQYGPAKGYFEQAVGGLPPGQAKFAAQTWADIAEGYYDAYKSNPRAPDGIDAIKQAQRAAQEAIRNDPGDARPHYTLSKIYNDSNLSDLAQKELEEAVKLDPTNYLYAYELGRAYFSVRKFPEAQRAFESSIKLNPRFAPAHFNLGVTFLTLRNESAALQALRSAVSVQANYTLAHVRIGNILAGRNDLTGAINAYNSALSFDPSNVSALRGIGAAYAANGQFVDAEKYLDRALIMVPDAVTFYTVSKVKHKLGKSTESIIAARRAVELSSTTAVYHYQLGLSAESVGDLDTAITAYARAVELDKNMVDPRISLGRLYLESGFVDRALTVLDEAYRIDPKSLAANNNLADAYKAKGMHLKSVFHYEEALKLSPRDLTIRLNLARAYVQAGSLQKAKESYIELVKLDPSAWDAMFELGKTYVSLGDSMNAKKTLSDLIAKKPDFRSRAEVARILAGL